MEHNFNIGPKEDTNTEEKMLNLVGNDFAAPNLVSKSRLVVLAANFIF